MSIPIACTLDAAEARAQVGEWQQLVLDTVERCERVSPTRTELVLHSRFDDLNALARLLQRETRCCAFFRFTIDVRAGEFVVVVEVPEEASSVLASFIDHITAGTG